MNTKLIKDLEAATYEHGDSKEYWVPVQRTGQDSTTNKLSLSDMIGKVSLSHTSLEDFNNDPEFVHLTGSQKEALETLLSLPDGTLPVINNSSGERFDSGMSVHKQGVFSYISSNSYPTSEPRTTGLALSSISTSLLSPSPGGSVRVEDIKLNLTTGGQSVLESKVEPEGHLTTIFNPNIYDSKIKINENGISILGEGQSNVSVGSTVSLKGRSASEIKLDPSSQSKIEISSGTSTLHFDQIMMYLDMSGRIPLSIDASGVLLSQNLDTIPQKPQLYLGNDAVISAANGKSIKVTDSKVELASNNSKITIQDDYINLFSGDIRFNGLGVNMGVGVIEDGITKINGSIIDIGNESASVSLGEGSGDLNIGGKSQLIYLGLESQDMFIGEETSSITIGAKASSINIASDSSSTTAGTSVSIGGETLSVGFRDEANDITTDVLSLNGKDISLKTDAYEPQTPGDYSDVTHVYIAVADGVDGRVSLKPMDKASFKLWLNE